MSVWLPQPAETNQMKDFRHIYSPTLFKIYLFLISVFFWGGVLVPHLCGLIPVRPDLEMGGEYCLTKEVLIISPK